MIESAHDTPTAGRSLMTMSLFYFILLTQDGTCRRRPTPADATVTESYIRQGGPRQSLDGKMARWQDGKILHYKWEPIGNMH